jgi:hypothetical protein
LVVLIIFIIFIIVPLKIERDRVDQIGPSGLASRRDPFAANGPGGTSPRRRGFLARVTTRRGCAGGIGMPDLPSRPPRVPNRHTRPVDSAA